MASKTKDMVATLILKGKTDPSVKSAFAQSSKLAENTASKLQKIVNFAAFAAGATLVVKKTGEMINSAIEYGTTLSKLSTIADSNVMSLGDISKGALALSNKTGVAAGEITEGLYQTISATGDTANALNVMEVALKAAKGGFTDSVTAVDGLTTVLNAYNLSGSEAATIGNQFLVAQNKGKTTFGEMAQSIGKVAKIMESAKIGTDEMLASVAVLTANGLQTSESVSGMKAAISNIIAPSSKANEMAKKLGINFSAEALAAQGLAGFMAELNEKTGGNLETMSQFFGSVEGLNAALILSGEGGMALMNETMKEMQSNTTALEDAFSTMAGTPAKKIARLQNKVGNLAISIGQKLLPTAETVISKLEEVDFDKVVERINAGLDWLIANGNTLVGIAVALGAAMIAWNVVTTVQGVITAVKAWSVATSAMTASQQMLNVVMAMNPIGLVIAAVVAAVAAFVYFWNTSEAFRNFFIGMWDTIREKINGVGIWMEGFFDGIWTGVKTGFASFINFLIGGINVLLESWLAPFNLISKGLSLLPGVNMPEVKLAIPTIPAFATGGTVTAPTLGLIGEAGVAETIIPHTDSPRSRGLLAQAAAGIGGGLGDTYHITFAPVIKAGSDVKEQLDLAAEEFERRMDAYFANKRRKAFG